MPVHVPALESAVTETNRPKERSIALYSISYETCRSSSTVASDIERAPLHHARAASCRELRRCLRGVRVPKHCRLLNRLRISVLDRPTNRQVSHSRSM